MRQAGTPEEEAAVRMLDELDAALRPYWGFSGKLPETAVLVVHPALSCALRRIVVPSYDGFRSGRLLPVPLLESPALPYGAWQLVLAHGGIDGLRVIPDPWLAAL